MMVWALLGSTAKFLVMNTCVMMFSQRREATVAEFTEKDVLSHI